MFLLPVVGMAFKFLGWKDTLIGAGIVIAFSFYIIAGIYLLVGR